MTRAVQFRVLGGLEVLDDDGAAVDVGGTQPRAVLAALLVACGRVVGTDALSDAVWGDAPPASAAGTLQTYVSRLRRALEPHRGRGDPPRLLRFEPPGYRLAVDPDAVDFLRFEALADRGRDELAAGAAGAARVTLLEAEALWRGPALAEYRERDFARGLATRLEERRLAAVEDRVAADLALGRHAALVGELGELVREFPWREGLRASLALALYRGGRQADALRAIEDARRTLREELGVDPGRPLQELEAAILDHDPVLDLRSTPAPVRDLSPAAVPVGGTAAPLVGRGPELAELLDALPGSTARVVVLEGEPGIGKTRLAEEVAAAAQHRGMTVLWSRAFEGGATPALWPWLPPLRALAELAPPGTELAPDLRRLLAPAAGREEASNDTGRFGVFEAAAALLATCAAVRPVVLVLDDIQWADSASLELLRLIGDRLRDEPVLLVCTVRELEVGRNDDVVETLAALTRRTGTRRLRLRGLDRDASAELVRLSSVGAVGVETLEAIHERAEGNPFFVTELARLVASGAGLGDVPSGVRDVVRRRLAGLPEETVALLQVAAVVGREVDLAQLTAASGVDLDRCLDRLEPAILQRLLVISPENPSVHRFAHALVREVVVDDISTLKQARLHLKVADALHEDDDTIEIVAEHLWSAVPIGVGARAAAALERASTVAVRRFAYAAAQSHLERAAQLRRTAGSSPADVAAEARTLQQLVAVIGARQGHASLIGSPLLTRAKQCTADAGMTLEHLNLLWVEWAGLDLANRPEAHTVAEQLLAATTGNDHPLARVLGHTAYGISCWHRGRLEEAAGHLDAAAREATDAVDGSTAPFLTQLDQVRISAAFSIYVHEIMGDLDDADRRFDEVVALVPGDLFWELLVRNFQASAALSNGDVERSIRVCERGIAADPDGLSQFWSMALRCYLGAAYCLHGEVDRGLALFDPAWAAYRAVGLRTNGATWLASRAHGLAVVGRIDEAKVALAEAWTELDTYGDLYAKSTVLLAEAMLAHARDDDPAPALREAHTVAIAQGAGGMAARIARQAAELGVDL